MPRYGGTYIKNNIYSEPLSMDPIFALGAATIMVQMNIFDGLVRVDADWNVVVPDIAERWTHSPDGKTFTFYLRKGVLYHDGSEVTADDFKFQFERVADPENLSPHMSRLAGVVGLRAFQEKRAAEISGIRVIDRYTLQISMERPNIMLPYLLTGTWASAVPRQVVQRLGREFGTKPVGSGPFVFERWLRGREIVLNRNPRYWRKDRWGNRLPYVDQVVFRMIRDMAAVEAEIAAGNIDSAYIRDSAYPRYKSHPVYRKYLVEGVEFYTSHVGFNLQMAAAPWADRRVRQAINHAIDRKTIVDVVRQGKSYVATGILPLTMLGHDPTLKGYEYDPAKARRLLAEAGYPNGFSARILSSDSAAFVPTVEAIIGYLNAVGIRLQYEVQESTTARVRQQEGKYELYFASLGGEGHPLIFLQRGFHSRYAGPGGNYTRYHNPRVEELLDRAAEARDQNTMIRLVRQAERLILDDAPVALCCYLKGVVVQQPYVRGLRATPIDMDWQPLEEVWLAWPPKRR
jgi:ABC-type transport system substrate-binding protein